MPHYYVVPETGSCTRCRTAAEALQKQEDDEDGVAIEAKNKKEALEKAPAAHQQMLNQSIEAGIFRIMDRLSSEPGSDFDRQLSATLQRTGRLGPL